jgi:pimeloyl-ACP methyl ester carboxylesterase
VVLLHSFPEFWWAWRHQIAPLAAAGYRVAALDLRGAGASDKPPIGYDAPTRTRDVAGVIRSLGASRAVVVGHGWGGTLAWSMAALQPSVTTAVAALGAPHPARLHAPTRKLLTHAAHRRLAFFQLPTLPERALVQGDLVAEILAEGFSRPLPDDDVAAYRTVMRIPFAAHTAMEVVRWAVRSTGRPDGRRYTLAVRRPIAVPALQVHGDQDAYLRRELIDADGAALARDFRFEVIEDAGHFLPEDAPDAVTDLLLDWLARAAPLS